MSEFVLINGRLIDGTGKEPLDGCGIVVKGASISAVGPSQSLPVPADAQVIDVGGRTIMPGLIDAHTHLTYHVSEYGLMLQQMNESLEMNALKAAESARVILETGCTAIGDGASRGKVGMAIRDGVKQGLIPGPKVVAAGQIISGSAGIGDHTSEWGYFDNDVFLGTAVNGPQEVRTMVRKQIRQGVDYVKVAASGTPGGRVMNGRTQDLSYEELVTAVQEAAKFGKRVHAHAHDPAGIKDVARSGIMSLHSGEFVDEEGLHMMKEMDCVFVPTISWLHFRIKEEYAREFTSVQAHRRSGGLVHRGLSAGVRVLPRGYRQGLSDRHTHGHRLRRRSCLPTFRRCLRDGILSGAWCLPTTDHHRRNEDGCPGHWSAGRMGNPRAWQGG
jgi:imidazolonepropionase-like amidohydrolase